MASPWVSRASGSSRLPAGHDASQWISALRGPLGPRREAQSRLHGLLLRAARFELDRRAVQLTHVGPSEIDDLAVQAADDALMAILGNLDGFRGTSRFTTWASKFAVLEAGVKARRRAWQGSEIPVDDHLSRAFADTGCTAQERLEAGELRDALSDAIQSSLTPHQHTVFSALALNAVPIDVLAERLHTTWAALYNTLQDARLALQLALADAGYQLDSERRRKSSAGAGAKRP
jgi:RNA polymerase sigma-70 factor (ECF subfamily)